MTRNLTRNSNLSDSFPALNSCEMAHINDDVDFLSNFLGFAVKALEGSSETLVDVM